MSTKRTNPYVGPDTFQEEDKDYFFGRKQEAQELLSLVISEPLVLFYAQSGAGKSSLLNTCLIPDLRQEDFYVLPVGRVSGRAPEGIDINNIFIFNLLQCLGNEGYSLQEMGQLSLTNYLNNQKPNVPIDQFGQQKARVLVIDQFEEILTTNLKNWRERQAFFEQLNQAIHNDSMLWVVLAMREDHIAALDPYAHLLPDKLRARFYMQRMKADAALEAIKGPAKTAGRPFVHEAAQELVDNLRQIRTREQEATGVGEFVEPVQLQLVCLQLWDEIAKKGANSITQDDVELLADVDQALAQYYEKVMRQAVEETGTSELLLRTWFQNKLITKGETRGIVPVGDTDEFSPQTIEFLQKKFLLRLVNRAESNWYELVHDRFISPILEANQAWFQKNHFLLDVDKWQKERAEQFLYEGKQLQEALEQARNLPPDPLLRDFLNASQKHEEEKQQQAYELVEKEKREQEEKRRLQMYRIGTVVGVFILLLAIFAAVQAVRATQSADLAEANAVLADEQRGTAVANAIIAGEQRGTAEASADLAAAREAEAIQSAILLATQEAEAQSAREEAQENLQLAQASQLAFHSNSNLSSNPQLSRLLAVEASQIIVQTSSSNEAIAQAIKDTRQTINETLSQALENAQLQASWFAGSYSSGMSFSPHGRFLLSTSYNSLQLWNIPDGSQQASLSLANSFQTTAFSEDGRWLAAIDTNNTLLIWNLNCLGDAQRVRLGPQTCQIIQETISEEGRASLLQFSPDGRFLVTGGTNSNLNLWDVSGETPILLSVPIALQDNTGIAALAFSADSSLLAIAFKAKSEEETGVIDLWDSTGNNLQRTNKSAPLDTLGEITSLVFVGERQIAGLYEFGVMQIWTIESTRIKFEKEISQFEIAAFSPGNQLIATTNGGQIKLWNTTALDAPFATLNEHDFVRALALSPDGSKMASTGYDGRILLWDTTTLGYQELNNSLGIYNIYTFQFSEDGEWLSATNSDGMAYLWVTTPTQPTWKTTQQTFYQVPALALDGDGRFLALSNLVSSTLTSTLPALTVWDVTKVSSNNFTQAAITTRLNQNVPIVAAAFATDRPLLATAAVATDKTGRPLNSVINLYDLSVPNTSGITLTQQSGETLNLAFQPNGRWLAASYVISSTIVQSSTLQLWAVPDNPAEVPLQPDAAWEIEGALIGLSFSPDGTLLATSSQLSDDVSVKVWDISNANTPNNSPPTLITVQLRNTYRNIITPRAVFSPDGSLLIASDRDGLRVWQVADLRQGINTADFTMPGLGSVMTALTFTSDGTHLAAGDENGLIYIWETAALRNGDEDAATVELSGQRGAILSLNYTPDGRWLISRSSEHTTRLWQLETTKLVALTCQFTSRNLTQNEWETYLALTGNETYRLTCNNLPPHPTALIALLEKGQNTNHFKDALAAAQQLGASVDELRSALLTFIETYAQTDKQDLANNIVIQAREFNSDLAMDQEVVATIFAQTDFDHGLTYAADWDFDLARGRFLDALQMLELVPETLRKDTISYPVINLLSEARNTALDGNIAEANSLLDLARFLDPNVDENQKTAVATIYHQNCRSYLSIGETANGEAACHEAFQLALQVENSYLTFDICLTGAEFGEASLMQEACPYSVQAAADDAYRSIDMCNSSSRYPGLAEIIAPACINALPTLANDFAYDPYYSMDFCSTVLQLQLVDLVEPVCGTAVPYSRQTGDFTFSAVTCQTAQDLGITLDACVGALPNPIAFGETVSGSLDETVGYELWSFDGTAGQIITISMNRTDDLDPYLSLLNPAGLEFAYNDDDGGDLNSLISFLTLPETGTYIIVARGYGGTSFGSYELTLELEPE